MTCRIDVIYKRQIETATCLAICIIMLYFGKEMKLGALEGIRLSSEILIPTLFPFLVLSDYWSKNFYIGDKSPLSKLFVCLFHMPSCGILAFISGIICGFPLGVKVARDLYDDGKIDERQLITLCGFSNNPSMAFVISGVGLGIFKSFKIGIILFISCILSAILCGIIFRKNETNFVESGNILRQKFNLVESIKSAGLTSITISSYVIFFSAIIFALKPIKNSPLLVSTLELCSAVEIISKADFGITQKLALIAFSLGFSGLSVHMQSFSFMGREVKKSRYLLMKFTQGVLSSIIVLIIKKAVP